MRAVSVSIFRLYIQSGSWTHLPLLILKTVRGPELLRPTHTRRTGVGGHGRDQRSFPVAADLARAGLGPHGRLSRTRSHGLDESGAGARIDAVGTVPFAATPSAAVGAAITERTTD